MRCQRDHLPILRLGAFLDERGVYEGDHTPIHSEWWACNNFIPDHVAYGLVKGVYAAFGLDTRAIPAFDENRNFILQ